MKIGEQVGVGVCTGRMSSFTVIVTHIDDSRGSKAFSGICVCVCLGTVCPQHNSKTNDPKVFKLVVGNDLGISKK